MPDGRKVVIFGTFSSVKHESSAQIQLQRIVASMGHRSQANSQLVYGSGMPSINHETRINHNNLGLYAIKA